MMTVTSFRLTELEYALLKKTAFLRNVPCGDVLRLGLLVIAASDGLLDDTLAAIEDRTGHVKQVTEVMRVIQGFEQQEKK